MSPSRSDEPDASSTRSSPSSITYGPFASATGDELNAINAEVALSDQLADVSAVKFTCVEPVWPEPAISSVENSVTGSVPGQLSGSDQLISMYSSVFGSPSRSPVSGRAGLWLSSPPVSRLTMLGAGKTDES